MEHVKSRREMYAESTRRALLETGRRMFVERGFQAVAAEDLVRAAGLSRGALYHHFGGKPGLFEAVFEEQEERAARRIESAMTAASDPWDAATAGMDAFLDVCAEPDYREIVLLQGPIALGWRRWRELDRRHLGHLLVSATRSLVDGGLVQDHPADLLAAAIYGSLTEISLAVADSDAPETARAHASRLARGLLAGLAPQG